MAQDPPPKAGDIEKYAIANLYHTQKMEAQIAINWFNNPVGVPPIRLLLLGTDGSGGTQTIRTTVTTLRQEIARRPPPLSSDVRIYGGGVVSHVAG